MLYLVCTLFTIPGQTLKSLMKIDLPKNVISSAEITCKMDELSYSTGFTITLYVFLSFKLYLPSSSLFLEINGSNIFS